MNADALSGTSLAQLLRLASPLLPIGAYSYSQGLEWSVEEGAIRDEQTALQWIVDSLRFNIGTLEAPIWQRLYQAWDKGDINAARHWNARFVAIRETAELRAETQQMGGALKLVLDATGELDTSVLEAIEAPALPTAFSFAANGFGVPLREGLIGYLWTWGENQASSAMKLVPLGQSAGQRVLARLVTLLPSVADAALQTGAEGLSNFSPALAIASSRHETQYTRLFRS
ncbi:MAG TPA: urease accessory protein UreF [Burkholderiales bacterium]|jgi:urease accessory protein|nr:urease accessory protein UreF [Burkholderiales bacterium]